MTASEKMAELAVVITGTILDILGGRGSVQQYQRVHDYILSELSNLADHEAEKDGKVLVDGWVNEPPKEPGIYAVVTIPSDGNPMMLVKVWNEKEWCYSTITDDYLGSLPDECGKDDYWFRLPNLTAAEEEEG